MASMPLKATFLSCAKQRASKDMRAYLEWSVSAFCGLKPLERPGAPQTILLGTEEKKLLQLHWWWRVERRVCWLHMVTAWRTCNLCVYTKWIAHTVITHRASFAPGAKMSHTGAALKRHCLFQFKKKQRYNDRSSFKAPLHLCQFAFPTSVLWFFFWAQRRLRWHADCWDTMLTQCTTEPIWATPQWQKQRYKTLQWKKNNNNKKR